KCWMILLQRHTFPAHRSSEMISHAFFGLPGSLNDINVLHKSPLLDNLASGNAPPVQFTVNGHLYDMGYYLADGIYPDWATLIKRSEEHTSELQSPDHFLCPFM